VIDFKDLIPAVAKAAPVLAGIIGGPVGSAAVSLIANVFGGNALDIPGLIQKISLDPGAQLKLKQIELQLSQVDAQNFSTQVQDNVSARQREVDYINKLGRPDYVVSFLSIFITMGFFGVITLLMFTKICDTYHDIIYTMLGFLGSTFTQIYQYYFGNSHKNIA
jgi:hypothetical protein